MGNGDARADVTILTHSYLNAYQQQYTRPFGGGLERYVGLLCRTIARMGLRPLVYQLSYYGEFFTSYEGSPVRGWTYEVDALAAAFERMADAAEGLIIYASCIWQPIAYRPGSIGICHGINWDYSRMELKTKANIAAIIGSAIRQLDLIVSVDSHFQTYCRATCEFDDSSKIALLPNSVDTSRFLPKNETSANRLSPKDVEGHAYEKKQTDYKPLRVLYPRRLSYERGVVAMMLVTDKLLNRFANVTVEFAGELLEHTPVAAAFQLWLEAQPHKERILVRTYSFDNVLAAYHAADIAVIPTLYSEGTSLSCLEAMSCGVPVVATDIGGLNDIVIDGLNGRLVPPRWVPIYEAICDLLGDASLRSEMGASARQTALAFDEARWSSRWERLIAAQLEKLGRNAET
ncbi:glycosyltransferase family 4 protein [Paenibacillus sp. KS-LC4]|uniref:glycosyltransferase family 4 protein n=1 Tax=Paenibacillus sp. KS-LC4 TaxID=2979727 RepID=UPI0030CA78B2